MVYAKTATKTATSGYVILPTLGLGLAGLVMGLLHGNEAMTLTGGTVLALGMGLSLLADIRNGALGARTARSA
ncbi:hypothetical protein [Salipiger sp.]|uniref:hypothetical protein n=1 Tax=Salipiger sp. TaxID=2078585 RepID=UPI003A97217B